MRNRSRTHTPVDLGNQTCIGELTEIRDVVDWCTSIPLDTPLARLVTADPSIGVIERDQSAGMKGLVIRSTYSRKIVATVWADVKSPIGGGTSSPIVRATVKCMREERWTGIWWMASSRRAQAWRHSSG